MYLIECIIHCSHFFFIQFLPLIVVDDDEEIVQLIKMVST